MGRVMVEEVLHTFTVKGFGSIFVYKTIRVHTHLETEYTQNRSKKRIMMSDEEEEEE